MENNHSTSRTREILADDVSNLKRDISQLAQDMKSHADAHLAATRELINGKIHAMRENLSHRPLTLLFAGFILGYLFAGRRRGTSE